MYLFFGEKLNITNSNIAPKTGNVVKDMFIFYAGMLEYKVSKFVGLLEILSIKKAGICLFTINYA
ncbi:MAG: hypothetical protein ABIR50_07465, partial [Ginsengibacter sp.]